MADTPTPITELANLADQWPEINPANYDQQDVIALNEWSLMVVHAIDALRALEAGWQPMATLPKTAVHVIVSCTDRFGNRFPHIVHFAEGGGEDQPRFGPALFYAVGDGFAQVPSTWKLHGWMPAPKDLPAAPKEQV